MTAQIFVYSWLGREEACATVDYNLKNGVKSHKCQRSVQQLAPLVLYLMRTMLNGLNTHVFRLLYRRKVKVRRLRAECGVS